MSALLAQIQNLAARGEVEISRHGFKELAADDISIQDVLAGVPAAEVIEEYPDYFKGPAIMTLQRDGAGKPIHLLWGVPAGQSKPAVLVTAYRPDRVRWEDDWRTRRRT
jgi:hypothetical protein